MFTDFGGQRRIHVQKVFAKKISVFSHVFSHEEIDATAAFLAKNSCSAMFVSGLNVSKVWDVMTEKSSQMFYIPYHKHWTLAPVKVQLIFTVSYKVFLVMTLGLIKSAAINNYGCPHGGDSVTVVE